MTFQRYDIGRIDGPEINDKGYLKSEAFATRSGVFTYLLMDGTFRRELRPPEEVFDKDSMQSLAEVVITNDHPPEPLNSKNTKQYAAGWTGKDVRQQNEFIQVDATITEYTTIYDILERGKQELSCGYNCDVEHVSGEFQGERYDAIQRNIRYNHLSVVDKGRAGPEVKLKTDSDQRIDSIAIMKQDKENGCKKNNGVKKLNGVSLKRTADSKKNNERVFQMTKIKIDNVEYEISEALAPIVNQNLKNQEQFKADSEALKGDVEKLQGKIDALESELKKKDESIKALEDKKLSDEEILKRADSLNQVRSFAKKILGDEFKSDVYDIASIKKSVVAKAKPELKLEEKSDAYIDGVFDALVEHQDDKKDEDLKSALGHNVANKTSKLDSLKVRAEAQKKVSEDFANYKGQ